MRKQLETKAVYVRPTTVGYSGADVVHMRITLPRAPWEPAGDQAAPEGGGRVATSAKDRNETARRMKRWA